MEHSRGCHSPPTHTLQQLNTATLRIILLRRPRSIILNEIQCKLFMCCSGVFKTLDCRRVCDHKTVAIKVLSLSDLVTQ